MFQRTFLGDVLAARSNYCCELYFPVGLRRSFRQHDVVVRSADAGIRFQEDKRFGGHGDASFGGVVGVVERDADHLSDPPDTRSEPRATVNDGKRSRIEPFQPLERFGEESIAADVVDYTGQITYDAGCVEHPGSFLPCWSIPNKLHLCLQSNATASRSDG